jgi:hypothetical protein
MSRSESSDDQTLYDLAVAVGNTIDQALAVAKMSEDAISDLVEWSNIKDSFGAIATLLQRAAEQHSVLTERIELLPDPCEGDRP